VIPLECLRRRCPVCHYDTIIGHGRRRRQCHDDQHECIWVRRGLCEPCGKTFTILPDWLAPAGHYSLHCRQQSCERIAAGDSTEQAAPHCKDSTRLPDLWIPKTPSRLKMQVFGPFVRSIRPTSSRPCNIVTSRLATLNFRGDRVLAADTGKRCRAHCASPANTPQLACRKTPETAYRPCHDRASRLRARKLVGGNSSSPWLPPVPRKPVSRSGHGSEPTTRSDPEGWREGHGTFLGRSAP
jgi:uncharacterized protein DUF6431